MVSYTECSTSRAARERRDPVAEAPAQLRIHEESNSNNCRWRFDEWVERWRIQRMCNKRDKSFAHMASSGGMGEGEDDSFTYKHGKSFFRLVKQKCKTT